MQEKNVLKIHDSRELNNGEVPVPIVPDNMICLPILVTALNTRTVLKVVPKAAERMSRQQYTNWQNEYLGHFTQKNIISYDALKEEHYFERGGNVSSPEENILTRESHKDVVKHLMNNTPPHVLIIMLRFIEALVRINKFLELLTEFFI